MTIPINIPVFLCWPLRRQRACQQEYKYNPNDDWLLARAAEPFRNPSFECVEGILPRDMTAVIPTEMLAACPGWFVLVPKHFVCIYVHVRLCAFVFPYII